MSMALNKRKIFTNSAGSLIWAHNLRGATEGGQGTKQSTPTEALDPLDQPTPNQTQKTKHPFLSKCIVILSQKRFPGTLTLSTPITNSFLQYQLQLRTLNSKPQTLEYKGTLTPVGFSMMRLPHPEYHFPCPGLLPRHMCAANFSSKPPSCFSERRLSLREL